MIEGSIDKTGWFYKILITKLLKHPLNNGMLKDKESKVTGQRYKMQYQYLLCSVICSGYPNRNAQAL